MKITSIPARQGDVLFLQVAGEVPAAAKAVEPKLGKLILAEGEVTGHAHAVLAEDAELLAISEHIDRWLRVSQSGTTVVHGNPSGTGDDYEHYPVKLPGGGIIARRQVEYAPEELRLVAD